MLLTTEQVRDLTGLEKPSAQSRWLSKNHIQHFISAKKEVKVTWEAVNNPKHSPQTEPDFSRVA